MQKKESDTLFFSVPASNLAEGLADRIYYTVPRFPSYKEHFLQRLKTYDGGRLITCGKWQIQERKANTIMPMLYGDARFCIQEARETPSDTRMGRARITAYRVMGYGEKALGVRSFGTPYTRADMPDLLASWLAASWVGAEEKQEALRAALAARLTGPRSHTAEKEARADHPGVFSHMVRYDMPGLEEIKKEMTQSFIGWRHPGDCTVDNIYALYLQRDPAGEITLKAQHTGPSNRWEIVVNGRACRVDICRETLTDPDSLRDRLVCIAARAYMPQPEREKLLRAAIRAEIQAIPHRL